MFVIIFDFVVKLLRAYFIDIAGSKMEKTICDLLFKKITAHDEKFLTKSSGIAHTVREFESVRDFFTSASMVAFIDLPFMFIFLFVIYLIAGPLAIVPILIVPLVLGVSALIQPILKRYSEKFNNSTIENVNISRADWKSWNNKNSCRRKFLNDRWNSSVETQSDASTRARAVSNFSTTFASTGYKSARREL